MSNAVVHDNVISVQVGSQVQLHSVVDVGTPSHVIVQTGIKGDNLDTSYVKCLTALPISGHRVLAIGDDSKLIYADSSNIDHIHRVAGISISAFNQDVQALVMHSGLIEEPSWNWEFGKPVILGLNGMLVQDIDQNSVFYMQVGRVVNSTTIVISVQNPFIL